MFVTRKIGRRKCKLLVCQCRRQARKSLYCSRCSGAVLQEGECAQSVPRVKQKLKSHQTIKEMNDAKPQM